MLLSSGNLQNINEKFQNINEKLKTSAKNFKKSEKFQSNPIGIKQLSSNSVNINNSYPYLVEIPISKMKPGSLIKQVF